MPRANKWKSLIKEACEIQAGFYCLPGTKVRFSHFIRLLKKHRSLAGAMQELGVSEPAVDELLDRLAEGGDRPAQNNAHWRNKEMVFDWVQAAQLIGEHFPEQATAGVEGSWDAGGWVIWDDWKIAARPNSSILLGSLKNKPQLCLDGVGIVDCWVWKEEAAPGCTRTAWWPALARKLIAL